MVLCSAREHAVRRVCTEVVGLAQTVGPTVVLCASALELSDLIFMGRILAFVMCIKGHAGQWEESSIGGEVERFQNRSFHGTLAALR